MRASRPSPPWLPVTLALSLTLPAALLAGCGASKLAPPEPHAVILIDVDDHGLGGLWAADAPNLKGLIAGGTFAYSRVIVPTHSNQSNIALLTAQYPDGNGVPANSWLSRADNFAAPLQIGSIGLGEYARYDKNPLIGRSDSLYQLTRRLGARSAYVGQLPPFEAGADDVHLSIVGLQFGSITLSPTGAPALLEALLSYPADVATAYHYDGPPDATTSESLIHFTLRDAANVVRASSASQPLPHFMFVWDFLALDDDPTGKFGADSPQIAAVISDYDAGVGELLAALDEKGLRKTTDILFTLDHGKVDTHNQVVLGTRGADAAAGTTADGQLAALVASQGAALGLTTSDYALVNEDGDALLYARVPDAGTPAGAAQQLAVRDKLLGLVQSGAIVGLDTSRTLTADGALGTRRFDDYTAGGPGQPDITLFPKDDWTLNQVDATNATPGPFQQHGGLAYGRHGGFSEDELYVPLIMNGPDFKAGALLPHPVNHPDVPATVAWLLGGTNLAGAEGGPIAAALAGDGGETLAQPADMTTARALVLAGSGYGGAPALATAPATVALVVDLAGVYFDELFGPGAKPPASLRAFAAAGTVFESAYTRYRDWPVNEWELLAGGYPAAPTPTTCLPHAESDPDQTVPPACGFRQGPVPAGFVASQAGYDAWRAPGAFAGETLFGAAHALGMSTALLGEVDFHDLHVDPASIDLVGKSDGDVVASALSDFLAAHPKALAVVALGGARTGDRRSTAAKAELATLARQLDALVKAAPGALVLVTSRGGTAIDDAAADFYGTGSARHVPLIVAGPNVRAGVVTGQPAQLADIPATVLMGLGAPLRTDFADGTWAAGTAVGGIAQPLPARATGGHALVRAFQP